MLTTWLARFRHGLLAAGALLLLLLLAQTAWASPDGSLCWAEGGGFSVRAFFSGLGARSRVIHLCIVVMCIALFILMKKFHDGDSANRSSGSPMS
jgi:hypothetical protein